MLSAEPLDQLVAARLLDFFGAETPWQRRLWDVGTCLTLREIIEAADAVVERALSTEALDWLKGSALAIVVPFCRASSLSILRHEPGWSSTTQTTWV